MIAVKRNVFVIISLVLFLFLTYYNRYKIGDIAAPVHINIEIDKQYIAALYIKTYPGELLHRPISTDIESSDIESTLPVTVIHAELSNGRLIDRIDLVVNNTDVLDSIDNISVFIGNSLFYLPSSSIKKLPSFTGENTIHYTISDDFLYKRSLIKNWTNYYGDPNFIMKSILAPFMFPVYYWPLYLLLLVFTFYTYKHKSCSLLTITNNFLLNNEKIIFIILIIFAFLLRYIGYLHNSAWGDETPSAWISHPSQPIIATFNDPGQPPFFYIFLRFWFTMFDWTIASARMLSILSGTGLIAVTYILVRKYSGIKAALLAALSLAVSKYNINVSLCVRQYVHMMLLVTLLAYTFLNVLHKQKSLVAYTTLGLIAVNCHYYGILFIAANFFIYVIFKTIYNEFKIKVFLRFFIANCVIAVSFLPYFFYTALNRALLVDFNTWIKSLGLVRTMVFIAALAVLLIIFYIVRKCFLQRKLFQKESCLLLDYLILAVIFVTFLALVISIFKPIFTMRYMAITMPFIAAGAAVFLSLEYKSWYIRTIMGVCSFLLIIFLYHITPHGKTFTDVSKESWEYITMDALEHPNNVSFVLERFEYPNEFFSYDKHYFFNNGNRLIISGIPEPYTGNNAMNVLYVSPVNAVDEEMFQALNRNGFDSKNIIRIKVDNTKTIFKKYFMEEPYVNSF